MLRPFQVAADRVAEPFRDAYGWLDSLLGARSDAARLEKENETLRQQVVESRLAERENARLRQLLRVPQRAALPGGLPGPRDGGHLPSGGRLRAGDRRRRRAQRRHPRRRPGRDAGRARRQGEPRRLAHRARDAADGRPERRLRPRRRDRRVRHRAPRAAGRGRRFASTACRRRPSSASATRSSPSGWSSPRLSSLYPRGIRIGRVTSVGRTDTDLYTQVQVDAVRRPRLARGGARPDPRDPRGRAVSVALRIAPLVLRRRGRPGHDDRRRAPARGRARPAARHDRRASRSSPARSPARSPASRAGCSST